MSNVHICTPDTFLIDAPQVESECPLCLMTCTQEIGWTGIRCANCGHIYELEMVYIARSRREDILKLTRKEMSVLTGYSPATIKKYEWGYCTTAYYDKTTEVVREKRDA